MAVERELTEELVLPIGAREQAALEELSRIDPEGRDPATIAEEVLRNALAAKLERTRVEAHGTAWERLSRRRRMRLALLGVAVAVLAVVLVGGYGYRWGWTGFAGNNQLWDWLQLLLLPVAFGVFALWLRYGSYMSRPRRLALAAGVVAFAGLVAAGYLVPLRWTGFRGNTLWDWMTLLLLPLLLMTVQLWPTTRRELHARHISLSAALAVAFVVTLVGGYAGSWAWTGYPGNTLWDWLQLALGPIVIATLVIPAAVRWMSGNVERRAREAEAHRS